MCEVDLTHREVTDAHSSRDAAEQRLAASMAEGAASRPLRSLRPGASMRSARHDRSANSTFRASMLQ